MSNLTIEVKNDAMLGRTNEKTLHITLIEQQKEIEELKRQIKIKDEYFHLIWMIGCDYDGYETPKGLKSIIDELVEYANYGAKNDDEYVKDLLELRKDEE